MTYLDHYGVIGEEDYVFVICNSCDQHHADTKEVMSLLVVRSNTLLKPKLKEGVKNV